MNVIMVLKSILSVMILFAIQVNGLSSNGPFSRQIADKCDLTARRQCSSDCTKILACLARIETPILSINCTGSTPYCENGRCVTTPGKCIKKAQKSFLCTSSGVFPDPMDCRQSHSCAEVGSHSVMSVCPRGHIFDSKNKLCVAKPSNYDSICQEITCDGVTNDFVAFTANPTYYAYCFTSATGVEHTYMYKCDDEINKAFDVTSKKCRFNCKSIGYFADPMDCTSYYICNGLKFASRRVHCPPNYYFNGTVCLNSKAHCPKGSIVNATTAIPTTMIDISMAPEMSTTETVIAVSSLAVEMSTTPTVTADSSLAVEMSTTPTVITGSSLAVGMSTIPTVIADSSLAVEMTTSPTVITGSSFAVEMSTTPIADSSLADEVPAHEPTTTEEVTTDSTAMSFSEHITTETSTTHKPTTVDTVASQINLTTKKPSIWKHMGLISVRVGKFLNIF